jgi:integrase
MASHKFHVGEIVNLRPVVSRNVPGGAYEVTKQLPHNGREFAYRIKSAGEEHERVAGEGRYDPRMGGAVNGAPRFRTIRSAPSAATLACGKLASLGGEPHARVRSHDGAFVICRSANSTGALPHTRSTASDGLQDMRLHDLRLSYASLAADRGVSLQMIGKLLGDKAPATTQRYAQLA